MCKLGVGVEGPSDLRFWRRFLHRRFPRWRFDVRNLGNRDKLIRASARLLETFRSAHYEAGFIILDQDKNPCVTDLVGLFGQDVRVELQKPIAERYLFLCVASRKIESWFLADRDAVKSVLPSANYVVPSDTSVWGVGRLEELWKAQYGKHSAYNKIDFSARIASEFCPSRAISYSRSFRISWQRIQAVVNRCA